MANFSERNLQVGQYHYGRHYNSIGIWQVEKVTNDCTSSKHIMDVDSWSEAKAYVYKMNGWVSELA